jgi:hypothetical protein
MKHTWVAGDHQRIRLHLPTPHLAHPCHTPGSAALHREGDWAQEAPLTTIRGAACSCGPSPYQGPQDTPLLHAHQLAYIR